MNKQRRADLLLVMTTFFWGASYYLTDICLDDLPPMTLNAFRFIVAFVVLGLIFWKHVRKFLFACGMISLMLFTLTACGSEDPAEEISRALHIDVSAGEEISSSDTHGGFHGDGISCVALQFPDSQVADAIAANAAWTPLPLDETAQALAYGVTREDGGEVFSAGPYLTDDSGDPLLPGIANGFYRLIDRHSDAGDGQNLLERASLNVTLAVYDADSDTLYFCEMDT